MSELNGWFVGSLIVVPCQLVPRAAQLRSICQRHTTSPLAMFLAVAVGGTTRDRVSRAGLARAVSKLPSQALIAEGAAWSGVAPLPCLVPEVPGTAVSHDMLPLAHHIIIGHIDPDDVDRMERHSLAIGGPGFNYMRDTAPPGALCITTDDVPAYTPAQWADLFKHYPEAVRRLRPTAVASFYLTRSAALIRDGADAFYRWANIVAANGPRFEERVAQLLGPLAPPDVAGAALEDIVAMYSSNTSLPEQQSGVAAAVLTALAELGGPQKEYDAFVLHVALRARAGVVDVLVHDFHYSVLLACVSDDPRHDAYLSELAPNEPVVLFHDIGIDPNCDDLLALRLAERIKWLCEPFE